MRWFLFLVVSFLLVSVQSCGKKAPNFVSESNITFKVQDSSVTSGSLSNDYGVSNGHKYHYSMHYLRGAGHNGKWSLGFYQLDNGDSKVRDVFNLASLKSVQSQLYYYTQPGDQVYTWDLQIKPSIIFTLNTIGEVFSGLMVYRGAAHPWHIISTVVLDTRNAHQLALSDIFVNENTALKRLSVLAAAEFTRKYQVPSYPPGFTPIESNFQHWVPTHEGFRVIFEDLQSGHGQPDMTIPWVKLRPYLKPNMQHLGD